MSKAVKTLEELVAEGRDVRSIEITEDRNVVIHFNDLDYTLEGAEWGDRGPGALLFARAVEVCGFMSGAKALNAIELIPDDWVGEIFPPPDFRRDDVRDDATSH